MKVVDLHPEELIDKLNAGELTSAERERLDAHLQQCSSCRFEIRVRADLELDAPIPELTFPAVGERTRPLVADPRVASVRPRSRRRWPLVMLAAALVLCAGGATAAVVTGAVVAPPWLTWAPEPKASPATRSSAGAKATHPVKRSLLEPSSAAVVVASAAEPPTAPVSAGVESVPAPAVVAPAVVAPSSVRGQSPVRPKPVPDSVRERASAAFAPLAPSSESAPSVSAHPEVAPARSDAAAALFADANRARRDGNADRAVTLYRALQNRYPASSESELSRALLAQLLLERGSPEAALAGFDRYLAADAPVLGAEALVGRARALEQLGKSSQASSAWREVESRFPGSVHARLAATRLAALGTR